MHEVHPVMIRLATQADGERFARTHPLWGIDCECALEGCGKRHTLYTTCLLGTEPSFVSRLLLSANPSVACLGSHPAKFREGRMKAYRLG